MTLPNAAPIVRGYHGTSLEIAIMIESQGFQASQNNYDWLGDGVYFFQDAPLRALEWARERYGREGAVVGAHIRIVNCMDLLDVAWNDVLSDGHDSYLKLLRDLGQSSPAQSDGAHPLDREVINYTINVLNEGGANIACVRAAFREGRQVYPDSAFFDRSHVQIAVRDVNTCIQDVWRESEPPQGV